MREREHGGRGDAGQRTGFGQRDDMRTRCGIECESYDAELLRGFDLYISDRKHPVYYAPMSPFAALGHWGQGLYILPREKLVIVRYADDRDASFQHNQLLKLVQAAFASEVQP